MTHSPPSPAVKAGWHTDPPTSLVGNEHHGQQWLIVIFPALTGLVLYIFLRLRHVWSQRRSSLAERNTSGPSADQSVLSSMDGPLFPSTLAYTHSESIGCHSRMAIMVPYSYYHDPSPQGRPVRMIRTPPPAYSAGSPPTYDDIVADDTQPLAMVQRRLMENNRGQHRHICLEREQRLGHHPV